MSLPNEKIKKATREIEKDYLETTSPKRKENAMVKTGTLIIQFCVEGLG